MSMLEGNSYFLEHNRFNSATKYLSEEKCACFQYKKFYKSVKVDNEKFTNFTSSNGTAIFAKVKEIYKNIDKYGLDYINNNFEAREMTTTSMLNRVSNIIFINTNIKLNNRNIILSLQKFDYKYDKAIKLYFLKEPGDVLNLVLVDIYHLAIPSRDRNYVVVYNRNKNNRYDIENVKNN